MEVKIEDDVLKAAREQPFHDFLQKSGNIDRIYDALQHDDVAETPIVVMDILGQYKEFTFTPQSKSEAKSNEFRNQGNAAYKTGCNYRTALVYYNKALSHAPENSQAMRLAYSNRSALLFTIQQYGACLKDIEAVFSMGCTDHNLAQRLRQRKMECLKHAWKEPRMHESYKGTLPDTFFKFTDKRHPEIKCASEVYVAVEMKDGLPIIVAARDIPVGKVVAIEAPFVCGPDADDVFSVVCYYCLKQTLHLIPCEGCCVAMFCSNECQRKCFNEYHNIECKIMDCIRFGYYRPGSYLAVRALLKMKHLAKNWQELIQASHNIGEERLRHSSVNASFDGKYKFSLLSYRDPKKHFIYGERYNASLGCGLVLLNLSKIPSFMPKQTSERSAALRAMARIMINLFLHYPKVDILNGAKDACGDYVAKNPEWSYGWFALAGKLNHCCDANLIALGLKNNIALVTAQPVKKGEEFTLSLLGHYFQEFMDKRTLRLFQQLRQKLCRCQVCLENWNPTNLRKVQLNAEQKQAYEKWISVMRSDLSGETRDTVIYKVTCQGLATFNSVRGSKAHHDLMQEFRSLMALCQFLATDNVFIHKDDETFEVFFPK